MLEMVDYLHHARELQVAAIKQNTEESLRQEFLTAFVSAKSLSLLLLTPPIALPRIIEEMAGSKENFLDLVYPAAVMTTKGHFILGNLERLLTACSIDSKGFKEVLIDKYTYQVFTPLKLAFKSNTDMLMNIVEEGYSKGMTELLEAVQGDIPLIKYRRDMIKARIELSQSIDGGEIGYLKTKIPSVDLKLWYPKDMKLPHLSFVVDDITQFS